MYIDSKNLNCNNVQQAKKYSMPSFRAVPLAKYNSLGGSKKNISIYQLEKTDINYLKDILDNIENFFAKYGISDITTKIILKDSIEAAITLLQNSKSGADKSKILFALSDNDPCAILIGNALKIDKQGKLHYSSRKNQAKNETELDAMVTWNNEIPCKGKAILCEYFHTIINEGFKHLYVRSEIPEYSFAQKFYETMGFKALGGATRSIARENDNRYAMNIFDYGQCNVVPMKATIHDIKKVAERRSTELNRKLLSPSDGTLLNEIDLT